MTWQDEQKEVATGVTDGTDGRKYSTVFPYEPRQECWCITCRPITMSDMRFVVCPDCGNKRCPKANNHRNACTNSNDVGQKGSSWEHVRRRVEDDDDIQDYKRPWVGLTDDEIDQGLLRSDYAFKTAEAWRAGVVFAMTKLKEKNT